jgi:ribonuclease VapC
MMAVDTSALMAIVLNEPEPDACVAALIVAARWNVGEEMAQIIDGVGLDIVGVTPAAARRIAQAHGLWGKGVPPAGLNLGDGFACEVAKEHGRRLLFVRGSR